MRGPRTAAEGPVERISTVLFDLDGTLSESAPSIIGAMRKAFADLGIPQLDAATEQSLIGPPWTYTLPPLIGGHDVSDVIAAYRRHYVDGGMMYETNLYPGVTDILDLARDLGCTLAVATSKPEAYAVPIVERLGLAPYFATVCGDGLHYERDTKALVIAEALQRLGNPPTDRVLMVGDRKHDVEGALAHGIDCIGVAWGYAPPGELEEAGAVWVWPDAADALATLPAFVDPVGS
ncbi:HAD hydrolase-like protein [Jatrophihabitans sp. YIM 134969]